MRKTPAQIGVALICGQRLPSYGEKRIVGDATLAERIRLGHDWLVRIANRDFGYDLAAWHDYLKVTRNGGYTWSRRVVLPKVMQNALASDKWRQAVKEILACPPKE